MIGPLAYIGGKNRLASKIIALLPEHTTYVEPFSGGAQVLFHKKPSRVEVLNDLDSEIVNFFRVCQWHFQELVRYLHFCVMSRELYEKLARADPSTLTDVQRAGRFFYLQKNTFGGMVIKRHYHYNVTHPPNYNPRRLADIIKAAHQRLQNVQIEHLPYENILEKYDRPTTLFYLDPPYWNRTLYRFKLSGEDFASLAERLRALNGKFALSLNDEPEVRKIFSSFRIQPLNVVYTARQSATKVFPEVLITNYNPP